MTYYEEGKLLRVELRQQNIGADSEFTASTAVVDQIMNSTLILAEVFAPQCVRLFVPRAGSGVERINPLHYLARCQ